jgi:DNA repair ATPase RecN
MGFLENEGFESLKRKAQRYVRDAVNEVKAHITEELERHMADLNASLDRLAGAISTEIQQVRDALQALVDADTTVAELQAQLAEQVAVLDGAVSRVDSLSTDLEADDPQAPPPVESV